MKLNKSNLAIKEVFAKGYRITNTGNIINPDGNIIQGKINKYGYKVISVRIKNVGACTPTVHRIAAYQKFGNIIFNPKVIVRHLNDKKLDNSLSNIAIGDASDNMMDIPQNKRVEKAIYASSFLKKYDYAKIVAFYNNTKSYKRTMDEFNISSKSALRYILMKNLNLQENDSR